MSENTQVTLTESIAEISMQSENDTDFTLPEHYAERITYHTKLLKYYLDEQDRENRERSSRERTS